MKTSKNTLQGQKSIILITLLVSIVLGLLGLTDWKSTNQSIEELIGLAANWQNTSQKTTDNKEVKEYTVERVVDGDTIQLTNGIKIRYLNIDTPETVKPNTPVKCFGPEAKNVSKSKIEGKQVWLNYDKEKQDRYGRDLAFVYTTQQAAENQKIEESLNAFLVKNGFARSVSYAPNKTYQKNFDELMLEAQTQMVGIWKACPKPFVE